MIDETKLADWMASPAETEQLEFKKAENHFDTDKAIEYVAALANERGGYLVLGVTDKPPRRIVGSKAFLTLPAINKLKAKVHDKLRLRIEVHELLTADGRVVAIQVPSRPVGIAVGVDGKFLMRCGEQLVAMTF